MSASEVSAEVAKVKAQRDKQEAVFREVNETHAGIKRKSSGRGEDKPVVDEEAFELLRGGYRDALVAGAEEFKAASGALEKLLRYMAARGEAKRRKDAAAASSSSRGAAGPPRKGDIWAHDSYVLPIGQLVAANTDSTSEIKTWILSSVQKYMPTRERYSIVDADPQASSVYKKVYTLDAARVVPLYSLEKYPLAARRILRGRVLALYPDTSTFYECRVVSLLKKGAYRVVFDDDDEKVREVPAQYVFPFPKGYSA